MATYYASRERLDRLIADPHADISEVVAEVDLLCRREAGAAQYYRAQPDLLYSGHPWLAFVAAGHAEYLGWPL